ncbi:RNA-dependent RNA polymerase [Botrytis cinerea binarnavirus 2]|uniref:RNA-dependent RNA polymerase n=1 Tax=Botrytis cinerea binarnavirus 2 TaxID=2800199 RepID=A0A858YAT8_9VIRU|nr:RNA-dependent RNA polymerase [Botrytis cinerea binarnavirus 2]
MSSNVRNVVVSLPTRSSQSEEVSAGMARLPLWYNRNLRVPTIPEDLLPFTEGKHFLSSKQVPSGTMLRNAGSRSVAVNRQKILKAGFTVSEYSKSDRTINRDLTVRKTLAGTASGLSESLASLLVEAADAADITAEAEEMSDAEVTDSGSETSDPSIVLGTQEIEGGVLFRKNSRYKIRYEDPWKIHAGRVLGEILGKSPRTILWSGDGIRLQDPLPPRVLGPKWEGNDKNLIRFESINADEVKRHVIYEHTHWGKALVGMVHDQTSLHRGWARSLRYRINRFLSGGTDPHLSRGEISSIFSDPTYRGQRKVRARRFIELLKTVDGIFTQRYLCYPEEVWTWERFDLFTLANINFLLGDEFVDGELTDVGLTIDTSYAQLKRARKWFKMHSHRGDLEEALDGDIPIAGWCMQFVNVWRRTLTADIHRKAFLIGVLSQTRGAGTPPALVVLQSKVKFLRTISTAPADPTPTMVSLRRRAAEEVLSKIPDSAFTGLSTKSRVTVTTSSCWESTRREGGTVEEIRRLILSGEAGDQVPVRDLDTGKIQSWKSLQDFESVGEFIFWSCLDYTLRTPRDALKMAFLTVVKEPGKARSVTKARACLKVVLDLVNKICSEPLKKGIKSSASGMGASNHGWNLFVSMMTEEERADVFDLHSREENAYEGYVERTDTFSDLFVASTDYEEATDRLPHKMGSDLAGMWMRKCGIPPLLRGIVQETCFKPRRVFFYATGVLETIGTAEPTMGIGVRSVPLLKGVLMGDPLTKVVLHLTNVITRHLGTRMHDPDFYGSFTNGFAAHEAFIRGMSSEDTPRAPRPA